MEAYLVAILIITAIYVLLALGLNLQYGLTGLINFGHVGFFCIGAYTAALLDRAGVPWPISFLAGAALAALAAWPLGLVSLKLRDDYFAIVSLGFSEIVRIVVTSEQWLT
ncbi:branched-chain amino acid ABC transporter permease, partial [Mesorhizobium sp. M2A.F.Ca.ET.040.01.1.1]